MADPEIINAIKEGFQAVAGMLGAGGGQSSGGNSGAAPKPSGDSGVINNAMNGMKKVGEEAIPLYLGFKRLTEGANPASEALLGFKTALSSVHLGPLAGVAQQTVGSILDWKTQMDAASKEMGIGGNNIGLFVKMAGDAGVTTKQFADIVHNTGVQSVGLGANAQKGAEAFSKLASDVRQSPIGTQLQDLGMSTEELASVTALSAIQNRKSNMSSAEAAVSAQQLAVQLDETARLTGVSREQMAKELAADEKRPEIRALENLMQKEQIEGYQKSKKAMEMFGQPMVQLTSELASGKLSKAGQAQMAALGDAGREYEAALKQQMAARSPAEKAAADAALEVAQAHVAARMASKEFSSQAVYSSGAIGDQSKKMLDANQGMENVQKAAAEFRAKGMSENDAYVAALKKNKEDAANLRQGKDEKGKDDPGQNSARLLNKANENAATQAAGLANNFKLLNDGIKPGTKIYEVFTNAVGYTGKAQSTQEATTDQQKIAKGAVDSINNQIPGSKATQAIPDKDKDETGRVAPYKSSRDGGTLAKTGSPVEPEDAIVKIHKGETVLTPEATKGMGKQLSEGSKAPSPAEVAENISSVPSATAAGPAPMSAREKEITKDYSDPEATAEEIKGAIAGAQNQIKSWSSDVAEQQDKIDQLKAIGAKRQLTSVEELDLKEAEQQKARAEKNLAREQDTVKVLSNLDEYKAKLETENKQKTVKASEEAVKIAEDLGIKQVESVKAHEDEKTKTLTEAQKNVLFEVENSHMSVADKISGANKIVASATETSLASEKAAATLKSDITAKAAAEGRELTNLEKGRIERAEQKAATDKKHLDNETNRLETLKNIDAIKAQAEIENKQKVVESDKQASEISVEANKQASEISGISAKEQEAIQKEAVSKATANVKETLTINGKAVDPNSPEGKEAMGKIQEAQAKMKEAMGGMLPDMSQMMASGGKLTVDGKEVDPNSVAGKDAMSKLDEAKSTMSKSLGGMLDMPTVNPLSKEEAMKQIYSGGGTPLNEKDNGRPEIKPIETLYSKEDLAKRSASTGALGSMFAPKIVDQKAADAQKAKIAEAKAAEAKKTSEATPKKSDADSKKEAEAKKRNPAELNEGDQKKASAKTHDATLKDLNDQLVLLNKHMVQLINHSEKSADANAKTAKATQKATGVR